MKSITVAISALAATCVHALNPILIKGNVFYDSVTKERFYLKAVDYQPLGEQGVDPLIDPEKCLRDLFLFQQLGLNAVRIYTSNYKGNHDECMSIFNAGGIYVILDLNSARPGEHINREEPWTSYNSEYITHVLSTVTVFSGYENVIGYFLGNELINSNPTALASPPYMKALARDIRSYSALHLNRPSLIGYSAADNIEYREETAQYMACGTAKDGVNDFYAINSYQFCGKQTLQSSGYDQLVQQFKEYNIPLWFSEIGCNQVRPRTFDELPVVYGPDMNGLFSGLAVYEFTQEANEYGLGKIEENGDMKLLPDYDALQRQFASLGDLPRDIPDQPIEPRICPSASSYKYINGSTSLPSLAEVDEVIRNGVSAKPGKLIDVTLRATKYKIFTSSGVEITDKTPKEVGKISHVDLSSLVHDSEYAPDLDTPKTSSMNNSSSSNSNGGNAETADTKKSIANRTSSINLMMMMMMMTGILLCLMRI